MRAISAPRSEIGFRVRLRIPGARSWAVTSFSSIDCCRSPDIPLLQVLLRPGFAGGCCYTLHNLSISQSDPGLPPLTKARARGYRVEPKPPEPQTPLIRAGAKGA